MATGVRLNRTVSQALMAQLVTEALGTLGSDKTASQPLWSDYEAEKVEPSTIVYRAVERVSGLSESYIAFGPAAEPTKPAKGGRRERRKGDDGGDAKAG